MKEHKTISSVLIKGHLYVNIIAAFITIFIWFTSIFLSPSIESDQYKVAAIFVGVVLGSIGGWLYWSFAIVRWRIWAFQNIKEQDWHKLKSRAISQNLFWPDDNIFNKTEIRSKTQEKYIQKIDDEIANIKIDCTLESIQDDLTLPSKKEFYFKASELILNPIILTILALIGVFLIYKNRWIIGVVSIATGVYLFKVNLFKNLFNKKRQMIISDDGIEMNIDNLGFINWSDTEQIELDFENWILSLSAWKNEELYNVTFPIGSLNIKGRDELLDMINIYQKRNQLKNGKK